MGQAVQLDHQKGRQRVSRGDSLVVSAVKGPCVAHSSLRSCSVRVESDDEGNMRALDTRFLFRIQSSLYVHHVDNSRDSSRLSSSRRSDTARSGSLSRAPFRGGHRCYILRASAPLLDSRRASLLSGRGGFTPQFQTSPGPRLNFDHPKSQALRTSEMSAAGGGGAGGGGGGNIKVVVRCRPLNQRGPSAHTRCRTLVLAQSARAVRLTDPVLGRTEIARGARSLVRMEGQHTYLDPPDVSRPRCSFGCLRTPVGCRRAWRH